MGRKKKEELPEIKIKLVPRTEEEAEAAVKRLAAILAARLGWVPKELARKGRINKPDINSQGSTS